MNSMNKIGVLSIVLLLFTCSLVSAALNDSDSSLIDKAYTCLENSINNKTTSSPPSLQESIFTILALGSNKKAEEKIENEKRTNTNNSICWPKAACSLKDTAQALLAYDQLGKDTTSIENYLTSKTGPTTGLAWYLLIDIDNHEPASCTIKSSNTQSTITIGSDMKLSGSVGGTCLSITPEGYWLEISNSCLDKSYEVSCNNDFITTILYKKSGSDTLFVSPNTHSASSSGYTNESIKSRCFKLNADCDYESSLWATLALDKAGKDISVYVPYLVATQPDNEQFLPASFLYKLTNGQDHYNDLIQAQKSSQYWQAPTTHYNKFYDTALALLALQGKDSVEASKSKDYLLSVQGSSGCWNNNNLRDTAFLLYAGWPDASRTPSQGSGNGTVNIENCESASLQYSCVSSLLACADAGGDSLRNYVCPGSLKCCSVIIPQLTCAEQNGNVCSDTEVCSGTEADSSDGSCCLGQCKPVAQESNQCEAVGGTCQSSCDSDTEDELSEICPSSGDLCCSVKSDPSSNSSSSSGIWITLLVILIILVVLAIVFRNRIKLWLFKSKKASGVSSSPMTIRRPPFPPSSSSPQRYVQRPMPARKPSQPDKEMEETLRKLKEMTK